MPSDTSPDALEVYYRRLAEMTPAERIDIALGLWAAADALQRAAVLREHPDASEEEVTFQLAVSRFGLELARKVYGRR